MKKTNYFVAVFCALAGHSIGIVALLLFTSVSLALDLSFRYSFIFSLISLFVGSAACGFIARLSSNDFGVGVLSGTIFALVTTVVSLFGNGSSYSFTMRVVIALLLVATSVLLFVVPVKKNAKTRKRKLNRSVISRNIK